MITEFKKYAGFNILFFFVTNPVKEIHIKGLSKELKISPSTSKYFCDFFSKQRILRKQIKGNMALFRLNNDYVYVKELKRVLFLFYLKEQKIEKIAKKCISFALYGSHASGDFNEKSDIDILIIGNEKDVDKDHALLIERKIGKQIQLTTLAYYKWDKIKKDKDPFALEILSKHILIKGVEL